MDELRADVLVVGAGPAGLAAAVAAARAGARVRVVDENAHRGGQIWRPAGAGGPPAAAARLLRAVLAHGVQVSNGLGVYAAPSPTRLLAVDADGDAVALSGESVVLATGATERFLPFPGWTLPGVCGAGGLQALMKGGLEVRGRRVVVAGSGPLLLAVAASLRRAGADVLGVFEQAPRAAVRRFGLGLWRHPAKLAQGASLLARLRGVPVRHDAWPLRALGSERLEGVELRVGGQDQELACDFLACGFGLVPATALAELCGAELRAGRVIVDALQRTRVPGVLCAGEPTGIGGVDLALAEGTVAGYAAAGAERRARRAARSRDRARRFATALDRAYALRDELRALPDDDTLVCRCEDVPFGAVRGLTDARQAKLLTRCGMGPCQGRVCGPALEILCGFGRDRPRPPLVPVPARALAAVCSTPSMENHE